MRFGGLVAGLLSVLMLASCGTGQSEVEERKAQVIAVHDEVMPLMGNLRSYERELNEKAELLEKSGADSTSVVALRNAAGACDKAYEGMFVWMRQFDGRLTDMDNEKALAYLQDQQARVDVVNNDIKSALADAERLLAD